MWEPSWRQRQLLLELRRAHALAISRRAALEAPRIRELADLNGIETGIAHQPRRDLHGFLIVTGNRHRESGGRTVRFALKDHVAERVEGAHQLGARQIFLRRNSDA